MIRNISVVAFSFCILSSVVKAEVTSVSQDISFEGCLTVIRSTASSLGTAPINIVESNIVRIVRFPTADGSVLVTCSKPDNKMVITTSDHIVGE